MGVRGLVNGKDAHDFAIDSIIRNPGTWNYNRIQFDIIDEFRRCNGRSQRSGMKGAPIRKTYSVGEMGWMRGRDFDPPQDPGDILSQEFLSERSMFIVEALARGWQQKEIAAWMGLSETRVSQLVRLLEARLRRRYADAVPKREAEEVHVRQAPRGRREVVEGGEARFGSQEEGRKSGQKEEEVMARPMVVSSEFQHTEHEMMHKSGPKKVKVKKVAAPKRKTARRGGKGR
jgi:DNA-directed RNA polymerase specialized sigma24 family protein